MTVKVTSVRATAVGLTVQLDCASSWSTRDGNQALRVLLKHTGYCSRGGDRLSYWFQCNGLALANINTREKLQAELDRLNGLPMAPSLFDTRVVAVKPGERRRTLVRDMGQVDRARAAGCYIEIDVRLATNFPLTFQDEYVLLGERREDDLCHEVCRVDGHILRRVIVHNMLDKPGDPWRVIRDMRAFIERALA